MTTIKRLINQLSVILLAAGPLAGCGRMEPDRVMEPIGFRVMEGWQLGVKSPVSSEERFRELPFAVCGRSSEGPSYSPSVSETVFDNQVVSYHDGWDYSPMQNWKDGKTYRFCAFWPAVGTASLSGSLGDVDGSIVLKGFECRGMAADQADLMLSEVVEQSVDDTRAMMETPGNLLHDGVDLRFHHLLCNVRVAVLNEGDSDIRVTSVQLVNAPNRGDFTTSPQDWTESRREGTWRVYPEEMTEYNSGETSVTLTSEYQTIWDEGFLVIPQTVNGPEVEANDKVYIRVRYESTVDGRTTSKSYEATMPDSSQWRMFTRITYQMIFDENEYIRFSSSAVESWGIAQASGTIIIK